MTTLVEFLRARLDEDELYARLCDAAFPGPWELIDRGHSASVKANAPLFSIVALLDQRTYARGDWLGAHLEHIARHQPTRVLAECAAKRRILQLHPAETYADEPEVEYCRICQEMLGADGDMPCPTLRALALPYAPHPDYDPTWGIT